MKTPYFILCLVLLVASIANGQGTLIYDQSSATNYAAVGGGAGIQEEQPMGQSFTPTLASVGFVQLNFSDFPTNSFGLGATLFVNLWSSSISNGILLSSTDPVFIPDGTFFFVTNFFFSTPVPVTSGTTYYLQPYVQSGNTENLVINDGLYNYTGGTWYFNGAPNPNGLDLWFREGVLDVPEPSSGIFVFLGSSLFLYARHKHKNHSRT